MKVTDQEEFDLKTALEVFTQAKQLIRQGKIAMANAGHEADLESPIDELDWQISRCRKLLTPYPHATK